MYVQVKVTTGAKREILERVSGTKYQISVREPAERNLANGRIRELIARDFRMTIGMVRIVSGHRSPNKILAIDVEK